MGTISDETNRMLERFQFKPPRFIQNVRTQVRDLDFDRPPCLDASVTMDRAWKLMREQKISAIPVVKEDGTLHGMLSAGDIATFSLNTVGDPRVEQIPLFNLLSVIEGRVMGDGGDMVDSVSGTVSIALPQNCENLLFDDNDSIVLCGSQPDMIRRALDKQVSCLILCQTDVDPAWLEDAGKTCIISTPLDASRVHRLIYQATPIDRPCATEGLISFHLDDYIDDVREVVLKSRYRCYPVLDNEEKVVGTLSRYHLLKPRRKRVVLVDHNELAQTVANIESTHPGYDEYRYSVDEIGHNPYELASYLSAKYHVYFREQVQDELREIFEAQYELTLTEEVEIRYRTETSTDPETGETTTEEVPYEYYILNVTLTNKTLPAVILPRLNEQQREIYTVMQQLKGNKPYLWEGIYNGGEDTGPSYEIPGEALDDPAFAALMEEATKYIGWPYVWGGSSPSTSFDCSGFVCWVYTASGVHNLPRTTAQGIYNQCAIISPSEAKPGDIIFFTGTYDSPGPVSHVGIYVGDGMMLHCGSPIQYANINSSYWQTHFYAFGRL